MFSTQNDVHADDLQPSSLVPKQTLEDQQLSQLNTTSQHSANAENSTPTKASQSPEEYINHDETRFPRQRRKSHKNQSPYSSPKDRRPSTGHSSTRSSPLSPTVAQSNQLENLRIPQIPAFVKFDQSEVCTRRQHVPKQLASLLM